MPGPPIRKPSDHSPPAGSPRNIAGHHVLHRPLMPRHPPNAQKNKQQRHTNKTRNTLSQKSYSKMLASTIQFTTNPPTPTHNPQQIRSPRRVRQPGRTAPEPRQHATPTHAEAPTTTQQAAAGVSLMPAPDNQPPRENKPTRHGRPPSLPRGADPPAGPDPYNSPSKIKTARKPPPQSILRKEVIQPHLPVRLPCYDFVPITSPTFDRSP